MDICGITLQQIEIFLTVAEQLNQSKAAKDLFLNQSAVSRWIQRMEANLGKTLFKRSNRGVELTEDGEFLYSELKPIMSRLEIALRNMRALYDVSDTLLRIGCNDTDEMVSGLHGFVSEFESMHENTIVKTELMEFKDLHEQLICGGLDCIFTYSIAFEASRNIALKRIKRLDSYFAVSSAHPLAAQREPDFTLLGRNTLFLLSMGEMDSGEKRALEVCAAYGFKPADIKYVSNYLTLQMAVKNGRGFTIDGVGILNRFEEDIRLFRIDKPIENQYVVVAWRKNSVPPLVTELIGMIPEVSTEEG